MQLSSYLAQSDLYALPNPVDLSSNFILSMTKLFVSIVAACIMCQISAFVPRGRFCLATQRSTVTLQMKPFHSVLVGGLIALTIMLPVQNAVAETIMEKNANFIYKLPPIDRKNLDRCKLLSSSIGQANAARDALYDLRECDIRGQNAEGKDQSGMIASDVSVEHIILAKVNRCTFILTLFSSNNARRIFPV